MVREQWTVQPKVTFHSAGRMRVVDVQRARLRADRVHVQPLFSTNHDRGRSTTDIWSGTLVYYPTPLAGA